MNQGVKVTTGRNLSLSWIKAKKLQIHSVPLQWMRKLVWIGTTCLRCCVLTVSAELSWMMTGWQRTAKRGEGRAAASCRTEAHRKQLKDSSAASEGILVEHPGWKYDRGITGRVGRGWESGGIIRSDGVSWKESRRKWGVLPTDILLY